MRRFLYLLWGAAVWAGSATYASPTCASATDPCDSSSFSFSAFSLTDLDGSLTGLLTGAGNSMGMDLNALIGQGGWERGPLLRAGSGSNGRAVAAEFGERELVDFGRVHMARVTKSADSFSRHDFESEKIETSEGHDAGHSPQGITGDHPGQDHGLGDDQGNGIDRGKGDDQGNGIDHGKGDDAGKGDNDADDVDHGAVVPEPVSFFLIGSGLLALGLFWRRSRV